MRVLQNILIAIFRANRTKILTLHNMTFGVYHHFQWYTYIALLPSRETHKSCWIFNIRNHLVLPCISFTMVAKYLQHQRHRACLMFTVFVALFVLHFAQFMSNNRTLSENYYVSAGLCEIAQMKQKKGHCRWIAKDELFQQQQQHTKQESKQSMMKSFIIYADCFNWTISTQKNFCICIYGSSA